MGHYRDWAVHVFIVHRPISILCLHIVLWAVNIHESQSWWWRSTHAGRSDGKIGDIRKLGIATVGLSAPVHFNSSLGCNIVLSREIAKEISFDSEDFAGESVFPVAIPFTLYIAIRCICICFKSGIDRLFGDKGA